MIKFSLRQEKLSIFENGQGEMWEESLKRLKTLQLQTCSRDSHTYIFIHKEKKNGSHNQRLTASRVAWPNNTCVSHEIIWGSLTQEMMRITCKNNFGGCLSIVKKNSSWSEHGLVTKELNNYWILIDSYWMNPLLSNKNGQKSFQPHFLL